MPGKATVGVAGVSWILQRIDRIALSVSAFAATLRTETLAEADAAALANRKRQADAHFSSSIIASFCALAAELRPKGSG